MPPDDPLGRHGPSLENFLRKRPVIPENRKQPCPYGKNIMMYFLSVEHKTCWMLDGTRLNVVLPFQGCKGVQLFCFYAREVGFG